MGISTIPPIWYEFAFNVDPNQSALPPYWQDLSARVLYAWESQRGRHYELDLNEAGTWTLRLNNDDGALNPANPTSPYAPNVKLYRRGRVRVKLNPSQNMLPQVLATGLNTMDATSDSAANWANPQSGSVTRATGLTASPAGNTTALAWTRAAGTTNSAYLYLGAVANGAASQIGPVEDIVQVTAGTNYTASAYFLRATSADATIQVQLDIRWYKIDGTVLTTTSGTPVTVTTVWGRIVTSGVAPAGAVWGRMRWTISSPSPTTAQNTIFTTDMQFEQGSTPTAWIDPGTTGFIFSGGIERLPQVWDELDGTSGTVNATVPDAFAALSTFTLDEPLINEIRALNPNFLFMLNDPQGSTSVVDTVGKRTPAPVEVSPYGAGSVTFGNSITSTNANGGVVGTSGPVATFNNNSNQSGFLNETFISIDKTAAMPGPPSAGPWTRVVAFRAPAAPAASNTFTLWYAAASVFSTSDAMMLIEIVPSGQVWISTQDNGAVGFGSWFSPSSMCDGNWHFVGVGYDPVAGTYSAWMDGVAQTVATGVGAMSGYNVDVLGAYHQPGPAGYNSGHKGDLACVAEFPALLTNAQVLSLYNSFRTASSGESTGARALRILNWVGWTGRTAIDSGMTQSMGPATDVTGDTALDALNAVAVTEGGDFYASSSGVLTLKSRAARYNQRTPVFVFGEGPPKGNAGEWPCEVASIEYDPSHLANSVAVTQWGGPTITVTDQTSVGSYYPRTYTRQINTTSLPEIRDAATYLLSQLKVPHLRPDTIVLHPSAVPGLFAVCLALEKGTRIRLIKRPIGAPSITVDCFVEQVIWQWDPDTGEVFVQLQASPADVTNYWILAALRTTLSAQAASGQAQATIVGLADRGVNPLAASLPSGYSLVFEPGTVRAEAMTIKTLPNTSPGYATATITFTTNFQFTHPAGSIVCEPLPTGYTDPTTWDASSVIGAAYTKFTANATAGTNTITVGALPDAAANALGSNWNAGDTLSLSPGTPQAETVTIKSVATTFPGYTSCVITLTANLTQNHAVNDWVTDPLPAGVTDPTTLAPTARRAY
jgi:hypothetical protein